MSVTNEIRYPLTINGVDFNARLDRAKVVMYRQIDNNRSIIELLDTFNQYSNRIKEMHEQADRLMRAFLNHVDDLKYKNRL
jgi:hypothetical protein